tara:strand:- start:3288 stop:3407 length:120 start_codon:yes stop_codon:yes gene_type:complete
MNSYKKLVMIHFLDANWIVFLKGSVDKDLSQHTIEIWKK